MGIDESGESPLPYGWLKEWDSNSNHFFYVDTKASPPRAIWVHPYEDEQFLAEHPDVREKVKGSFKEEKRGKGGAAPPAYAEAGGSSIGKSPSSTVDVSEKKKGLLGKLKDKTLGTKEEREAEKREAAAKKEHRRQRRMAEEAMYMQAVQESRAAHAAQMQYAQSQYGQSSYGSGQYGGNNHGPQYGPPPGQYGPGPYGPQYQQQQYYPQPPMQQQRGGGNMALPIVGGLLGGLILGDILF